ncbi:ABC transporter ATP-binding protein [Candidatus Phytoplasma solani]|uniref:ABC transporter ATP-binding protein n=1 Tax=Candidatus Phytoplasma solani TaxID=69896 RepID=UPI00358F1D70
MKSAIIQLSNLKINFAVKNSLIYALRGIDLSIEEGEILGLVGESGSGKSVIAKSIIGLLPSNKIVESGSIYYQKQNITILKDKDLNHIRGKEIAIILQNPLNSLNPLIKVGKQIEESLLLKKPQMKSLQRKKEVFKLLEEVGIFEPEKKYSLFPHQLSGGMCQRIVIAIALASQAKVLLCDEPTTALDVNVQKKILDLIKMIQKKHKITVLFISHDLEVIKYLSSRIAVIYAGKIIEIGKTHEIFYNSRHPYTWGLLQSMPIFSKKGNKLKTIEGNPPILNKKIIGDAFAPRNPYALAIDYKLEPPMFQVSLTHFASSWLLHPSSPKVKVPDLILKLRKEGKYFD